MKAVCAWCKRGMGEKDPLGDESVTHSICPECAMQLKTPAVALLERIEAHLQSLSDASGKPASPWMDVEECAAYTGFSVATIYKYVHAEIIPFCKPKGTGAVRFNRAEIDRWMAGYHHKGRSTRKIDISL